MPGLIRLAVPSLVALCLFLGGSTQGVWANLILQLIATTILASVFIRSDLERFRELGMLRWLALAFLALILLQFIPLPPDLWSQFPGREMVARGFGALRQPPPWLAWSLVPSESIAALFPLLIPFAVLAGMISQRAERPYWLIGAVLIGTLPGILLGFVQVGSGAEEWYLYKFSNFGAATGFFANSNHMGSLLLVNLPFVSAIAADQYNRRADVGQRALVVSLTIGLGLILVCALALNRSLAVLLLGAPILLLSLAIPSWHRVWIRRSLATLAVFGFMGVIAFSSTQGGMTIANQQTSFDTRAEIWSNSIRAAADFKLTGSGLGTFAKVYRHYENPEAVDNTYVNHAHNDFLEVAVELGLPGLILTVLFLIWWARRVRVAWQAGEGNVYARAASIASAALMAHSLVDFPLRTAALTAVFAMCIGLLTLRLASSQPEERKPLWQSRHSKIG